MRKLLGIGVLALSVAVAGSALAADGAAVFKAKCSPCHGANGQGTAMAPAFTGNKFIQTSSVEDIQHVIRTGRAGAAKHYKQFVLAMPAWKSLTDDEVTAVIGHLKDIAGK